MPNNATNARAPPIRPMQLDVFLAAGLTGGVGLYTDWTGCAGMGDAAGMTGIPAIAGIAPG